MNIKRNPRRRYIKTAFILISLIMNSVQAQSDEMSGVSVTISDVGENFGDCIELASEIH